MTDGRQSRIKLRIEQKDYDLVGDEFQPLLAAVKALPERRFNSGLKLWEVAGSFEMARGQLENSGFRLEGGTPVSAEEQTAPPAPSNDTIKVEVAGYQLVVSGDAFRTMLEVIKAVPGRRFDGETKQWSLPASLTEMKAYFEKKGLQLEALPGQPPLPNLDQPHNLPSTDSPPLPADAFTSGPQTAAPPPPPPLDFPPPDDFDGFFDDEADLDAYPPLEEAPPPEAAPQAAAAPAKPDAARRDQIRVMVGDAPMVVVGGSFQDMLAAVKAIPGRRFDGDSKQWLLEDDPTSIQQFLADKGFQLVA